MTPYLAIHSTELTFLKHQVILVIFTPEANGKKFFQDDLRGSPLDTYCGMDY